MTKPGNHRRDRNLLPRFRNDNSGATAVEFAMTAPIFLTFLYGLLEVGRALITQGMLTYAVQQGARFAAVNFDSTTEQIQTVVIDSFVGIDPSPTSLTVTPTLNPDGTNTIQLTANYNFQSLVPILGVAPITLNASSSSWR